MMKHAPEWVRTSESVIISPARYHYTTTPASVLIRNTEHMIYTQLLIQCIKYTRFTLDKVILITFP